MIDDADEDKESDNEEKKQKLDIVRKTTLFVNTHPPVGINLLSEVVS